MKYPAPRPPYCYDVFATNKQLNLFNWIHYFMILLLAFTSLSLTAQAENFPNLNNDDDFSLMGALAKRDWHNIEVERWNLYTQVTYISNYHPSFPAAYTKLKGTPNSLSPKAELGFTASVTFYTGV